jgi:hypothetical protein
MSGMAMTIQALLIKAGSRAIQNVDFVASDFMATTSYTPTVCLSMNAATYVIGDLVARSSNITLIMTPSKTTSKKITSSV